MSFSNLQIDESALPRASALTLRPMAPEYVREVRLQQWITWGVILLVAAIPFVIVVRPEGLKSWLLILPGIILLLGAFLLPLTIRQAKVKAYAVREQDIAFRSGVYFRKTVILPLDRVQHAEVAEGPLQRRFGLASLKIYTAGGTSVDLQIDGLLRAQAEDLRAFILERAADRGRG